MFYLASCFCICDVKLHSCVLQCGSRPGSERNTPIQPYNQLQSQIPYQYDPRIQSCPATPLPSYRAHRFEFGQQTTPTDFSSQQQNQHSSQQQCMSLPNSARNTPIHGKSALFFSAYRHLVLWEGCNLSSVIVRCP